VFFDDDAGTRILKSWTTSRQSAYIRLMHIAATHVHS
jgi:hypothetical protein